MRIALRVLTRAGAYLKRQAVRQAEMLFKAERRFSAARQILDGYLLEGKRAGDVGSATIIDPPAFLAIVGEYVAPPIGDFSEEEVLCATLPRGRDTYLGEETELLEISGKQLLSAVVPTPTYLLGDPGSSGVPVYRSSFGITAYGMAGIGAMSNYADYQADSASNPAAYISPGRRVFYRCMLVGPTLMRRVRTPGHPSGSVVPSSPGRAIASSIAISSSLLEADGWKPIVQFAEDDAFVFRYEVLSNIWHDSVASAYTEGGYQLWVVVQAVADQLPDSDPYRDTTGALGLWIAKIAVTAETEDSPMAASVLATHMIDPLGQSGTRRPEKSTADEEHAYNFNCHIRSAPRLRPDGSLIIADQFWVSSERLHVPTFRYGHLDIHLVSEGRLVTLPDVLSTTVPEITTTEVIRAAYCIGCDVDEEGVAVVIVFGIPSGVPGNVEACLGTPLDVVVIDGEVATVALSQTRTDLGVYVPFQSSTRESGCSIGADYAYLNGFYTLWMHGSGGCKVAYIGNSKWAFFVGSQIERAAYSGRWKWRSDWALAVYDRASNTVSLVGVIDATMDLPDTLAVGKIECVRKETEDHPATIIVTRGGDGGTTLPVDVGQTFISYDSGETWHQLLDVGSAAGAFHCGNALQARTEPIVRV